MSYLMNDRTSKQVSKNVNRETRNKDLYKSYDSVNLEINANKHKSSPADLQVQFKKKNQHQSDKNDELDIIYEN